MLLGLYAKTLIGLSVFDRYKTKQQLNLDLHL